MIVLGHPVSVAVPIDGSVPIEYLEFMSEYGPGILCNAIRMLPPHETEISDAGLVLATSLQGDTYGVADDGTVVQNLETAQAAVVSSSLSDFLDSWCDGTADDSIVTPWFVPDGVNWLRGQLSYLTAQPPSGTAATLLADLNGAVQLSRIDSSASVQLHLWWHSCWLVATSVAGNTTKADFDLTFDVRTEADLDAKLDQLAEVLSRTGWIAIQ